MSNFELTEGEIEMDLKQHWERYFENHKNPCFVNDKPTGELLYCNESFANLYGLTEDWKGKKFHEVVSTCSIQSLEKYPNWDLQEIFETETYNTDLNQRFLVKSTVILDKDTIFNEIISLDENIQENSRFEDAMTRCVEIFEQRDETKVALTAFTELLADFYDAELAYIYRLHKENSTIEPVTSWVSPDFKPSEQGKSKMGKEGLFSWFQSPETPSLIISDVGQAVNDKTLEDIKTTFCVKNVVFAKVEDGSGEVVGFVGVSNRRDANQFVDFRFISTIARFVAQDVSKDIVDSTLFKLHYHDSLTGMYNRGIWSKNGSDYKKSTQNHGCHFR